jgi:C_GCAxxG_C_C family probable redox protein
MTHTEKAVEKFKSGFNCSQSVLWTYAPEFHLDPDTALRIANGFGAGMGIMVLGLWYGRGEHDGRERHEKTYAMVQKLIDAFVKKCGTVNCKKLLSGCDLITEEGRKRFHDDGLNEKCRKYVAIVCGILDSLRMEEGGG